MPSSVLVALCCTSHKTLALRVLEHACICARGGITCLCNICFRFAIRKSKAKRTSNHWFLKVFGGPRPSKTASEDPRRLPRGYLGLFGDVLSHLGAILETRAFKIAPASWDCARWSPRWPILARFGAICGPIFGAILGQLGEAKTWHCHHFCAPKIPKPGTVIILWL